jgi:hypothetical protein
VNPHPIGTFARLEAARARWRKPAEPIRIEPGIVCVRQHLSSMPASRPGPCRAGCAHVADEVWAALDGAYPDFPLEGPGHRQALAGFFAPFMALEGWRFCSCYLGHLPEHLFISRLVDTAAANAAADSLGKAGL